MITHRVVAFSIGVLLMLSAAVSAAVEVKLLVEEPAGVARTAGTITSGVPFAKGAVKDVSRLSVRAGGEVIPAQFLRTVAWPDGSVRWALLDCRLSVGAGEKAELIVRDDGANVAPADPVKVTDGSRMLTVSSGPMQLVIDKGRSSFLDTLTVDGKVVAKSPRGLVLHLDESTAIEASAPTEVVLEQAGPLRVTVRIKGRFSGVHKELVGYTTRLTVFAGGRHVRAQVWLENDGAHGYALYNVKGMPEWLTFDGLAVEVELGLGEPIRAACDGVGAVGKFKVLQRCPDDRWKDFASTISSGETELAKGGRSEGITTLAGTAGKATAVIRRFWQNYEKAIELDGSALRFWLWPTTGEWPRQKKRHLTRVQLDMLALLRTPGRHAMPGGVQKGHAFVLDFSGGDPAQTHADLSAPLFARATPTYYATTEAAPAMFAPAGSRTGDSECDRKLAAWEAMARNAVDRNGASSVYAARRGGSPLGFWYGWMDFGDISIPQGFIHGPCNLHYDWPWTVLLNFLRTGERGFLDLGSEMTHHRIDVDQGWTDRELLQFRGLGRGAGAYRQLHCSRFSASTPSPAANWISGVVLYYMLTGEPKARECAMRNAEGLANAWAHARKQERSRVPGDLAANAWSILNYCALYDLTADRKFLDEGLKLFATNLTRRWQSYGPHLHDGKGQIRSQDYIKDDIKYCYAIEALCELHRRSGDEKLLAMLTEACRQEWPESFYDAPLFLSGLFAYVGGAANDEDLLATGMDHFIDGFPESKSPPVFLRGNTRWSRRAGMTLRTGHILQYVHWKRSLKKR